MPVHTCHSVVTTPKDTKRSACWPNRPARDSIPSDRNDADYLIERHDDTILITVPASGQERRLTASGPSAPLLAVLLCGPLATLSTAIVS